MTVLDQAVRPPVGNQLSSSSLSSGVKVGVHSCKSLHHCNPETRKDARRELWENDGNENGEVPRRSDTMLKVGAAILTILQWS